MFPALEMISRFVESKPPWTILPFQSRLRLTWRSTTSSTSRTSTTRSAAKERHPGERLGLVLVAAKANLLAFDCKRSRTDVKLLGRGETWSLLLHRITINGVDVADSQFCVEYLNNHFGIDMNKHLSKEEASWTWFLVRISALAFLISLINIGRSQL